VTFRRPGPRIAWGCALVGVALVALAAHLAERPLVPLGAVAAHDGQPVMVQGRIEHAAPRGAGAFLVLGDGTHRLDLFVEGEAPEVTRGDEVEAAGVVRIVGGRFALAVDARDLRLLQAARDVVLRPAEVAEDPERYAGTFLRVGGELRREEGAWWLRDPLVNRALRVELEGPKEEGPGEAWGRLRYVPQRAGYVLEAASWSAQAGGQR